MSNNRVYISQSLESGMFEMNNDVLLDNEQLIDLYDNSIERLSEQKRRISEIESTLESTGDAVEEIDTWLGGRLPPSGNQVKNALTQMNSDYTSAFGHISDALSSFGDTTSDILSIIKILIYSQAKSYLEIHKSKVAHKHAAERLHNVAEKLENGEIELSDFMDLFDEVAQSQEERFAEMESKVDILSNNHQKHINEIENYKKDCIRQLYNTLDTVKGQLNEFFKQKNNDFKNSIKKTFEEVEVVKKDLKLQIDKAQKEKKEIEDIKQQTISELKNWKESFVTNMIKRLEKQASEFEKEKKSLHASYKSKIYISSACSVGIASIIALLLKFVF